MLRLLLVSFFVICTGHSFAQTASVSDLFGQCSIVSYRQLELVKPGMESGKDESERLQENELKGKGVFYIDANRIFTTNRHLNFDTIKTWLVHRRSALIDVVENDYSFGYALSFDLDMEHNRVSRDFVSLMDKDVVHNTLEVFDTDFKPRFCSWEKSDKMT